jgi:anaerobic ribonucleoside-triphosphate reductase
MNNDLKIEKLDAQINAVRAKLDDPNLCKGTASVSSRISGYYRPVHNWNSGKQSEFSQRQEYSI